MLVFNEPRFQDYGWQSSILLNIHQTRPHLRPLTIIELRTR